MPDRLIRWIDDPGFFRIVCETDFDPMLACASRRGQEVNWSCVDLGDPFFCIAGAQGNISAWQTNTCTIISWRLTVCSCVINFGFQSISVLFKCDVLLSSLDDPVEVTWEAVGDERP